MRLNAKVAAWALNELTVSIAHMRDTPFIQGVSSCLVRRPAIADSPLINLGRDSVFAGDYWTGAAI